MSETAPLRFCLLGPVRAWRGDRELGLGGPQQRLVLVILLFRAGRAVSIDTLVDLLWEVDPPAQAVGTVRTYISRLRRVLKTAELATSSGGYRLRVSADAIDLGRFDALLGDAERARAHGDHAASVRALRAALSLWDTEPLAGLPGAYASSSREQLLERRIATYEWLFESELALGQHVAILADLRVLADAHPLRERLQGQLMLALYRDGRQAEALAVFQRTRRLLIDGLGLEPGAELRAVQSRVLSGESVPEVGPPGTDHPDDFAPSGPPGRSGQSGRAGRSGRAGHTGDPGPDPDPPVVRPRQLPAGASHLVGRRTLSDELGKRLSAGTHAPVVLLHGIGGIGKSALAMQVAHRVSERFPDGQLYADLRGLDAEPTDPRAVLHTFLRALGSAPSTLPDGLGETAALFRSTVAGRSILLVLDNAADAVQVAPMRPGTAGCATVVTSRRRMPDLAATGVVDVGALSADAAAAMLAGFIGPGRVRDERDAVDALLRTCGHLPFAIRILGARLATRPTWTIASLADRLRDERRVLDELTSGELSVAAMFRSSYIHLEPPVQRAFRRLGRHAVGRIEVSAAAELLQLPAEAAEWICGRLTDAGLLESAAPGRYRFHGLVRLFARRCAEEEDDGDGDKGTEHGLDA